MAESNEGQEMLSIRFCLIGVGLILLAFGFLWFIGPPPTHSFSDNYDFPIKAFVAFIFYSLSGAGVLSIFRGLKLAIARESSYQSLPRIFPGLELRNLTARNRPNSGSPLILPMLNAFSVSWICVLMTLVIIFMVFDIGRVSEGLLVSWKRNSHISAAESPWPETMSVYVGARGKLLLNGKEIGWENLEAKLHEELGRRAEWTVYVEGDRDSMFMETAHVIDTIQELGAKPMWITPKTREEWKKQAAQENTWPSPIN
jgi:biopolymer transport protein ExbD